MARLQEDYLNMSQTTISFLENNAAVWNANAAITGVVNDIDILNYTSQDVRFTVAPPATTKLGVVMQ